MAGEIVHLEIPSRSFERSAAFYAKLFGWRTEGQQAGGHLRFELPGAAPSTTGSLVRSALAQATGPLPFIAVDDVDQTLAEAERQGGRVLARRLPLAGSSQYGLLADVDGNVIAVVSGAGASERSAAPETKKAKDEAPKTSSPEKTTGAAAAVAGKKTSGKKTAEGAAPRAPKPASKSGAARKR